MKKILAIAFVVLAFSLVGCKQEPEEEEVEMSLSEAMKYIEEVARMVDYNDLLDPNKPNLYKGPDEIQGECSTYALLFAQKTGASIIIVSVNPLNKNGIYKLVGKSNDSSVISSFRNGAPKDKNGDPSSGFATFNGIMYIYHSKLGLYRLKKVDDYIPKYNRNHAWNLLGTTEIDVNKYDSQGTWRP
jgi:hypothetical protein